MPSATTKPKVRPAEDQFEYVSKKEALTTRELYEEYLIALVNPENREHVSVTEERIAIDGNPYIKLVAHCHPDDIGKVIGKEGKCLEEATCLFSRIEGRNHLGLLLDLAR